MARPTITTDVPGCREVVDPGQTGLLCEARSATSMADAMRRFANLSRPEQLAMGARGREKAIRLFGQAEVIAAYARALDWSTRWVRSARRSG
jgi:glycosyltransferase involved in cell wall biosynthesis